MLDNGGKMTTREQFVQFGSDALEKASKPGEYNDIRMIWVEIAKAASLLARVAEPYRHTGPDIQDT